MDISVCIVTYNAAETLRACLESVLELSPHGGSTEVLVVDGCSTDGTAEIVRSFGERVRLVENPERTIASNRNVALREARHPMIAFTDSDCIVPPHWLKALSDAFTAIQRETPSLAGVGGGNIAPPRQNPFQTALGIALDSFLGSLGSVQGTLFQCQRPVPSIACLNALYSRELLRSVGGFDEHLENMCEDTDINYRLTRKGSPVYFIPGVVVGHEARKTFISWCVNMYRYGAGRARIMRKHRTLFSFAHAAALLFLPGMAAAGVAGFFWPPAWIVWAYIPLIFLCGCFLALKKHPPSAWRVGLILLGTHFCYSAGLVAGLLRGYPPPVPAARTQG